MVWRKKGWKITHLKTSDKDWRWWWVWDDDYEFMIISHIARSTKKERNSFHQNTLKKELWGGWDFSYSFVDGDVLMDS